MRSQADQVLPEVQDGLPGRRRDHRDGSDGLGASHGRPRGCHQLRVRKREFADGCPVGRGVSRRGPARPLVPGVVGLAVVELRTQHGARRRAPVLVGDDGPGRAVGVRDLQLGQERPVVTVDVASAAVEAQAPGVPAFAEQRSDGVLAGPQQEGDVEGLVAQAVSVGGPAGGQDMVADGLAVDLGRVDAVRGDVEPGRGDGTGEGEVAAEQRDGQRLPGRGAVRGDGPGRPVGRLQESGLGVRGRRPGRRLALALAPDAYAYADAFPGAEARPGPGDEDGLGGLHTSGLGDDRAVGGGDLHLVGGLPPVRGVGDRAPAQAGSGLADAQGLAVVLEGGRCDMHRGQLRLGSWQMYTRGAPPSSGTGSPALARTPSRTVSPVRGSTTR